MVAINDKRATVVYIESYSIEIYRYLKVKDVNVHLVFIPIQIYSLKTCFSDCFY